MKNLLLVPHPRRLERTGGRCAIGRRMKDEIDAYILTSPLPIEIRNLSSPKPRHEQWYRLTLSAAGIEIESNNQRGKFHAIQTVKQLLRQAEAGKDGSFILPCLIIEDWPEYSVRGVSLDIARDRVPTMETLHSLIDFWAGLKYNQLQLYSEHVFAYKNHPTVWKEASPLRAAEIKELDAYCLERGIELVPNQNSVGHMERWLKHPEYFHLAETPEGFTDEHGVFYPASSSLSPAVPESLDFLGKLYDELLPNFTSLQFNIGGDEPWELGQGRAADLCARHGKGRVYFEFLKKIHTLVRERGRKMQLYGDIVLRHPDLIRELPEDITIVNWGYEADHPFEKECEQIGRTGLPFYVCAGASSWNSIGGRWKNAETNIITAAAEGKKNNAEGFLISEWGDNGHWQQYSVAVPAYLAAAGISWNPGGYRSEDLEANLGLHYFGNTEASRALMILQDVWDNPVKLLHNASIQGAALLDPVFPYHQKDFTAFQNYDFEREFGLIEEAQTALRRGGGSAVLEEEIAFTARLYYHGTKLCKNRFAAQGLSVHEIPGKIRKELSCRPGRNHRVV